MLLQHKSSTIILTDIQNQPTFLKPPVMFDGTEQEYCVELRNWQKIIDRWQLDYVGTQIGREHSWMAQCCPKACDIIPMDQLHEYLFGDRKFADNQILEMHRMSGSNLYEQHRVFHEFLLKDGTNPCFSDSYGMTPTMRALEHGTLSRWVEALSNSGLSIEAVSLHTLSNITPEVVRRLKNKYEQNHSGLYPQAKGRFTCFVQRMYDGLTSVACFRQYICEELAKNGCHIRMPFANDLSPFELRSSSINFVPSTLHDPERATKSLHRRKRAEYPSDSAIDEI